MTAGEALPGDRAPWASVQSLAVHLSGLQAGDVVQVVRRDGGATLVEAKEAGNFHGTYRMEAPGFARLVVMRTFVPGVPALPALLSNPIYFE
jgi:hypothetical protein